MKNSKLFNAIILAVIGILLIVLRDEIVGIANIVFAVLILLSTVPNIIEEVKSKKSNVLNLVLNIVFAVLGILLFFGNTTLYTIVGILLLIICIYNLIVAKNKMDQLKKDLVKYILAISILFLGVNSILSILVLVVGILLIIRAVLYLLK